MPDGGLTLVPRHASALPVLLVDDDESVLLSTRMLLGSAGIRNVQPVQDGREVMPLIEGSDFSTLVLDLLMPHISGVEILEQVVSCFPEIPVIVMTASQEVETAIECMKKGAFDYLVKPVEESRFISCVKRAIEVRSLRQQVGVLKRYLLSDDLQHRSAFSSIVTNSRRMLALFQYVEAIAESDEPVLITGETGVGKGQLAQAVHRLSGRKGSLIEVNVAGLDEPLVSDTLFGHIKGAYSGAESTREGLVGQASGGTLMLDEIGDLNPASEIKLLRLIQNQEYYPLGSDVPRRSDVRVVCATNRDLSKRMAKGRFRSDLYFRLSVHRIDVPPLRERPEDIPLLVHFFIDEAARSMNKVPPSPPVELFNLLSTYHFPGNIRELRSMVFDAVASHRSGPVLAMARFRTMIERQRDLNGSDGPSTAGSAGEPFPVPARFPTLKAAENHLVREALRRAGGNQGVAATFLGISRPALNRRLARMKSREPATDEGGEQDRQAGKS